MSEKESKAPVDIGCECENCIKVTQEFRHLHHVMLERFRDRKKCTFCDKNAEHVEVIYPCEDVYDILNRKYIVYKLFGDIVDKNETNTLHINPICSNCYSQRKVLVSKHHFSGIVLSYFPKLDVKKNEVNLE